MSQLANESQIPLNGIWWEIKRFKLSYKKQTCKLRKSCRGKCRSFERFFCTYILKKKINWLIVYADARKLALDYCQLEFNCYDKNFRILNHKI